MPAGLKVTYKRVPRLFDELSLAKAESSYARALSKLAKRELLILDDLGIGPLTEAQRHDLLEVDQRQQPFASSKPRGVDERCRRTRLGDVARSMINNSIRSTTRVADAPHRSMYARAQEVETPRADRQEWAKRVQRWQDSGLSAREFASEMGLKASSLSFWKWRLKKDEVTAVKPATRTKLARRRSATAVQFVEMAAHAPMLSHAGDTRFEVVLATATIRVPNGFDDATLRRLLAIVRERS